MPITKYLKNYQPPHFNVTSIDLKFELDEKITNVTSVLKVIRNVDAPNNAPFILNGEDITLISIALDNKQMNSQDYCFEGEDLVLKNVPDNFTLTIIVNNKPQENTNLMGLYKACSTFCTQCEAEGFRRITYFPDRPDVLSIYTATIIADKNRYPVLLSNGDKINSGDLADNKHFATWHDPFKKPSYLFAMVAGDFGVLRDTYTTSLSNRTINLECYAPAPIIDQCHHTLESLKKAMRWDEQTYGLEYDLNTYMIVAMHDYNMGAMENKGLNVFNTKYVLADDKTATDTDYLGILDTVGHEYFHNYSGNRVSPRDWFQITLKEGLTVFRHQEFASDMTGSSTTRIEDAKFIRNRQLPEDTGPMAHPIRPESYIEMNNFYTMTVYYKGAEVIRMLQTIIGKEKFHAGMIRYFNEQDGKPTTCDDFVKIITADSDIDVTQFKLWYSQAGTPTLKIIDNYNKSDKTYKITIEQSCPHPATGKTQQPFLIPLKIGLLNSNGEQIKEEVLQIKKEREEFVFENIATRPIISLLRDFSAPVVINYSYSEEDLALLLAHDPNTFAKWEASQQLATKVIKKAIEQIRKTPAISDNELGKTFTIFTNQLETILQSDADPALIAELISLPSEQALANNFKPIPVDELHITRELLLKQIAIRFTNKFKLLYESLCEEHYSKDKTSIAKRQLKNVCLQYLNLLANTDAMKRCESQFYNSDNMTDKLAAFTAIVNSDYSIRDKVIADFYEEFKNNPLVIDKWFTTQASTNCSNTLENVKNLLNHPAFTLKNPNRARSLLTAFSQNFYYFNDKSGAGYKLLIEQIKLIDAINPMVAASLTKNFLNYKKFATTRGDLMKEKLTSLLELPKLSKDVREIVDCTQDIFSA